MKLFELKAELEKVEAAFEDYALEHEGIVDDFPLTKELDDLQLGLEEKVLSIGTWIKNLKAEAEALKAEAKNLSNRATAKQNRLERLKTYLSDAIKPGTKYEDSRCKISWRSSTAVEVSIDPSLLPEEYRKIAYSASKTDIKKDLEAGKSIVGAKLVKNENIQIK